MTSSALRERSARPCSPSAQRRASARLLLPEPFGPTTALIPRPNSTIVRSANDLKPWRRRAEQARLAVGPSRGGHAPDPSTSAATSAAAQAVHRLGRGRGLGDPARRPLADAEDLAVDPHLDPERAARGRVRSRRRAGRSAARRIVRWVCSWSRLLGLLSAPIGASATSSGVGQLDEPGADRLEPEVEVQRARRRPRTTTPAAIGRRRPLRWDSPSPRRRTTPRSIRAASRARPVVETIAARRADRYALVVVGMARVQRLGDGEVHDGVTEELEAFVVAARGVGVLVQPAGVDESLLEQVQVADAEARSAPRRPRRDARAVSDRRPSGPRRSARRCSRRRPGRCGSSPRPRPRSPSRTPLRGS